MVDTDPIDTEMAGAKLPTVGNADQDVDATVQESGSDSQVSSVPLATVAATMAPPTSVPTALPPVAGSGISTPNTSDSRDVNARFLREVGLSKNEVTGDVVAMQDAWRNRLDAGPPQGVGIDPCKGGYLR
ncbi:hypothetical protein BWQ96_10007 [Gracilariopsis chorda]|uniref:Uncharacterized protein n=1 Tax=Gracilariopsis chorda TaxID=448386 RepID=A0A2V3IDY3_9FLOR|nr:hypothetical protein BWQ96_10007 [Gracilariopsis chorda]|eukprot:PXF40283.1 hypothetical protein BWQ96_10007 [Gracilariopsis chorda]